MLGIGCSSLQKLSWSTTKDSIHSAPRLPVSLSLSLQDHTQSVAARAACSLAFCECFWWQHSQKIPAKINQLGKGELNMQKLVWSSKSSHLSGFLMLLLAAILLCPLPQHNANIHSISKCTKHLKKCTCQPLLHHFKLFLMNHTMLKKWILPSASRTEGHHQCWLWRKQKFIWIDT